MKKFLLAGYDVYYKISTGQTREYFRENLEKSVRLAALEGVILEKGAGRIAALHLKESRPGVYREVRMENEHKALYCGILENAQR